MQEIEEKAITTYHNNLAYCQKEHPALASKLTALDMLLNDGRYPTQYDLEYKEGYFDVKELATGNYLYKDNPQHLTQKILTNIDYKKNSNVLETFYNLSFSDAALEKVEASDAFTVHATSAPIIHYCNSVVNPNMHMKHIYKHIILGTGLGLHLPELVAKVKAQTYFIVEENLELFRLSLFTCDYATIFSNSTLFFSVAENDSEFKASFDAFYLNAFVRNHYLKFSLFNDTHAGKIKQMQSAIVSRPEIAYSHEYLLFKNDLLLQRIPLNYAFLDLSPKDKSSLFIKHRVVVLGAGPSLKKEIEWLKDAQHHCIIIAAIATLKTLQKHNITPDIVIQIDEKIPETEALIKSFDSFDFLKECSFIFSASVPQILLDTFDKKRIFLLEDRTHYKHNNTFLESASVGESAYAIALNFYANEIYLLGIDLALDAESGQSHSEDHHLSKTIDIQSNENEANVSLSESIMYIKGNFRDKVPTTPLFYQSIPILNNYTNTLKRPDQTIFNLSDGAFFDKVNAKSADQITFNQSHILDKSSLRFQILELFNHFSQNELSASEIADFSQRAKALINVKNIITKFSNEKVTSTDEFTHLYIMLLQELLNSEINEFKEILTVYLLNTGSYITDFFNTKELSNQKRHIKKLQKIIVKQLLKVIDAYEASLRDFM